MMKCGLFFLLLLISLQSKAQNIFDTAFVIQKEVIQYESGKDNLSELDQDVLNALIKQSILLDNPHFHVAAHTDDVGSEQFNINLSKRREQNIVHFLLSKLISKDHIHSSHHGETLLLNVGKDRESRAFNRRSVVLLYNKKKLITLSGKLMDENQKTGIEGSITMTSKDFVDSTRTDKSGAFKIIAPLDEIIELEILASNYFIKTNRFKTSKVHEKSPLKLYMPRADLGASFKFENMNFYGGKSVILPKSEKALSLLNKYMRLDTAKCIEIAGHINRPNHPKVTLNSSDYYLSVARALKIKQALVLDGVNPERVLSRGYGNWFMINPFAKSPQAQSENRRVEIVISDCDSTRLLKDHSFPSEFSFDSNPIDRYYTETTWKSDIENFSSTVQADIVGQLRKLKEAGMDPKQFTYKDLLQALPEIPKPK